MGWDTPIRSATPPRATIPIMSEMLPPDAQANTHPVLQPLAESEHSREPSSNENVHDQEPEILPTPPTSSEQWPQALPKGIVFVCCDDDDMPRIFAENVLLPAVDADMSASQILGSTYEEVAGTPDLIMALAARHGHDRVYGIFDQNLTNYHEGALFGTALVRELRQRGFNGVLVIQSANDETAAEREYIAAGADGSIGKVLRGGPSEIAKRLGAFWVRRQLTNMTTRAPSPA